MQVVARIDGKIVGYRNCSKPSQKDTFLKNYQGIEVSIETREGKDIDYNISIVKKPFTRGIKTIDKENVRRKIYCYSMGILVGSKEIKHNSDIFYFKKKCANDFGENCRFEILDMDDPKKEPQETKQFKAMPMYMYWWERLKAGKAIRLIEKHLHKHTFHASKEEINFIYNQEHAI